MKRGNPILLAAALAGVGALWAGAARAEDRESAGRTAVQVVVVNAPAPDACGHRAGYRDCGCYPANATSVTVLDAPFQPGAMYFVNQPLPARHGRWR